MLLLHWHAPPAKRPSDDAPQRRCLHACLGQCPVAGWHNLCIIKKGADEVLLMKCC